MKTSHKKKQKVLTFGELITEACGQCQRRLLSQTPARFDFLAPIIKNLLVTGLQPGHAIVFEAPAS